MSLMTALGTLAGMIDGIEQGPEPADVKAGWVAFAVFLLLCAAVALLGFSLVKQLRKAQSAKDAGVYGDEPVVRSDAPAATDEGSDPEAPSDHPEQSRG